MWENVQEITVSAWKNNSPCKKNKKELIARRDMGLLELELEKG